MAPRSTEQFELIRTTTAEKITASAIELFAENGYKNTSVASIAKRANVSKGLMYNYFESKESLLISIVESFNKMEDEHFKNFNIEEMTTSQLLDIYFEMIENNNSYAKMMISFCIDAGELEVIKKYINQKTEKGIKIIESIMEKENFDNPYEEAVHFITSIEGAVLLSIIAKDVYPLNSIKKIMFDRYKNK